MNKNSRLGCNLRITNILSLINHEAVRLLLWSIESDSMDFSLTTV